MDLNNFIKILNKNNYGWKFQYGRISFDDSLNKFLLIHDVPSPPTELGIGNNLSYEKWNWKIVYIGNNNYVNSYNEIKDLYDWLLVNKINDIIQIIPDRPVFIEKIKNRYKFVMLIKIINL